MFERMKARRQIFVENVRAGDRVARRWGIIYIGIALFIVIGVVAILWMNRGYKTFEVVEVIDKNDDVSVHYQVIGDGLIRYSKDGAMFTDKNGNVAWNQSFEMANAQVASCGEFVAIGDIGSNEIRLFNQAGQIAIINALYPVSVVEIANQGVTAAILSDGQQHYINLYDAAGTDLVKIKATMTNTGYPLDLALSEDGSKLAVSYLILDGGKTTTKIIFYEFGKTKEDSEASVVGTYEYAQIFPKIKFINNNTMVAFGEAGFEIFSMKSGKLDLVMEKLFDNEVKSIFYNEQYIGFVFRNDGELVGESTSESESLINPLDTLSGTGGESQQVTPTDDNANETIVIPEAETGAQIGANVYGHVAAAAQEDGSAATTSDVSQNDTSATATENTTGDNGSVNVPEGTPHESQADEETTGNSYPSLNQSISETAAGSGISEDGTHRYKLLVYTNTGNLYLDTEFDFDYHYIDCTNDEIIMYNDNQCYLMYYTGKEKFAYTFDTDISTLMPKQSKNEYIIVDDNSIKEIRLK